MSALNDIEWVRQMCVVMLNTGGGTWCGTHVPCGGANKTLTASLQ